MNHASRDKSYLNFDSKKLRDMNQERSKINNNEKDLFVHQKDKETRGDGGKKK